MNRQALVVLALLASFYPLGTGAANAVADATKALEMWQPTAVEKKGASLIVTAKERRVTSKIYNAMITGICAWAGTGNIKLSGVNEVAILNRSKASGWVFEGGAGACKRIAHVPGSKIDLMIAGKTHLYSCSSGRGCTY